MVNIFTNCFFRYRNALRFLFVVATVALFALAVLSQEQSPPASPSTATYIGSQACLLCHRDVASTWPTSVHSSALSDTNLPQNLQDCEACHGPGSAHAGSTGREKIANPANLEGPQIEAICAGCHSSERAASIPTAWPALEAKYWRASSHADKQTSCLTCHKGHGAESDSLAAPAAKLCATCHSNLLTPTHGGAVHSPVANGQCTLCHDPHGSALSHQLKPTVSQECERCHKAALSPTSAAHKGYQVAGSNCVRCHDPHSFDQGRALLRTVVHPPFKSGNCAACHNQKPSLALTKPAPELCFGCHSKEKILPGVDSAGHTVYAHAPASAGLCTKCHEPHVSDSPAGLVDSVGAICSTCHQQIQTAVHASHKHKPAAAGECLACHKPHGSSEKALLKQEQSALCLGCHKEQSTHAHPIGDKVRDPDTGEPVRCSSCHAVHGSEFGAILQAEETTMCRRCHRIGS